MDIYTNVKAQSTKHKAQDTVTATATDLQSVRQWKMERNLKAAICNLQSATANC